jgi:hypothetical protein
MANAPRPEPSPALPAPGARSGIAAAATPGVHGPANTPLESGAIPAGPNGLGPSAPEDGGGVAPPPRNCPPQRDLWPDICHIAPAPTLPVSRETPANAMDAPAAAKTDAPPPPLPAGTPEPAAPGLEPSPLTDWQGVLTPSPTPDGALTAPSPTPEASAPASSLDPAAFLGLGLALIFAIGLVAALLYLRRATARIADVEAALAEALGRPEATIEDALALILSRDGGFDEPWENREEDVHESNAASGDAPSASEADAAVIPENSAAEAPSLAVQASQCLEAAALHAAGLLDDPEFAIFARRLDLIEGSRAAARSLRELAGAGRSVYRQGMYERLQAGVFDGALTSLDVLAAYAHPDAGDWRGFLVHLEAAEALLTLALADCEIEVFRRPLLEPVERASLTDATIGGDARGLGSIPSAARRARTRMSKLGDDDRDIVFDCYSPGWRSEAFGSRGAFIAFFDPSSMTGGPP